MYIGYRNHNRFFKAQDWNGLFKIFIIYRKCEKMFVRTKPTCIFFKHEPFWFKVSLDSSHIRTTGPFSGDVRVHDFASRSDCSYLMVPRKAVGFVNGKQGAALRWIEEQTGTRPFCFRQLYFKYSRLDFCFSRLCSFLIYFK